MSCSHNPQSLSKLELLPLSEKKDEIRGKSEKVELAQIISIFYKKKGDTDINIACGNTNCNTQGIHIIPLF